MCVCLHGMGVHTILVINYNITVGEIPIEELLAQYGVELGPNQTITSTPASTESEL